MGKVRGHIEGTVVAQHRPGAAPDVVTAGAPLGEGDVGSVPSVRERLRSRDLAVKVFVAGATYVALVWINKAWAVIGAVLSPIVSDLVRDFVERHRWSLRRLRRGTAATVLLGHEEEAYASRRRAGRRGPGGRIPGGLMAGAAAVALVTAGIATANLGKERQASGSQRPGSTTTSTTTTDEHLGPPARVTGLDGQTPTAVAPMLTWAPVPGARRYVVFRDGKRVSTQTAHEFSDPTASLGVLNYKVAAMAHGHMGPRSRRYTIVYQATPPPPPSIHLTQTGPTTEPPSFAWNTVPGATEYVVYRDGSRVDPPTTATRYADQAAVPGVHGYRVAWIRAEVESRPSHVLRIDFRPVLPPPPPLPPTDLSGPKATADPPVLTWTGVDGADGYTVYRDDQPVGMPTVTSFTDKGATEGSHTYYVTARAGGAESGHSNTVRVAYVPRLPAPTGLSAPPTYTSGVVLTWYPVPGAAAYEVYRDGAPLLQVKDTSFTDNPATAGMHSYTVATVNRIGVTGPQSGAVTVDYVPPGIP